jgi:hypothetical protein
MSQSGALFLKANIVRILGTAIQLYGTLRPDFSTNAAAYQIDDHPPKSFPLQPSTPVTFEKQLLFNYSSLTPGEHTVIVTHNGTSSAMPLEINYFTVTSLTTEQQAALAVPQSSVTPQASSMPTSSASGPSKEVIIGTTIGAVVFLFLMACLVIFYFKLKRHKFRHLKVPAMEPRPESFLQTSSNFTSQTTLESPPTVRGSTQDTESHSLPYAERSSTRNMAELRLGNLKLQQRVEVLLGRSAEQESSSISRIHVDSGWRMGTRMNDIPPNYTEA